MVCMLLLALALSPLAEGFHLSHGNNLCRYRSTQLFENKEFDVEAASTQLGWEGLEASANRPVLNLSDREASPEDDAAAADTSSWDQGQLWQETQQGLLDRGVSDPSACLDKCPQLLRLPPAQVLESADLVLQEYGLKYLESEPKLLLYRADQIRYGLEFMSTMMMMDATAACKASPPLLLSGIEGGIQEQAVQAALGAAGAATSQANQRVVGDAMAALQSLKNKKPKGL